MFARPWNYLYHMLHILHSTDFKLIKFHDIDYLLSHMSNKVNETIGFKIYLVHIDRNVC